MVKVPPAKASLARSGATRIRKTCGRSRGPLVEAARVCSRLRVRDPAVVRKEMQRMCSEGQLLRLGRNLYVRNRLLGHNATVPASVFPWWGNKRRLAAALASVVLEMQDALGSRTRVVSPFAGTAVVEGTLRNLGVDVTAYDLDANVVNMHRTLESAKSRACAVRLLRAEVARLRQATPASQRKALCHKAVPAARRARTLQAVRWNLGMRCSFLGMLRPGSAPMLQKLQSLRVPHIARAFLKHRGIGARCQRADAFSVIRAARRTDLLFLDPPYLLERKERQYVAGDFDLEHHKRLAAALRGRHFLLCHREDAQIKRLYEGWCDVHLLPCIMRINRAGKSRREMIVIGRP